MFGGGSMWCEDVLVWFEFVIWNSYLFKTEAARCSCSYGVVAAVNLKANKNKIFVKASKSKSIHTKIHTDMLLEHADINLHFFDEYVNSKEM